MAKSSTRTNKRGGHDTSDEPRDDEGRWTRRFADVSLPDLSLPKVSIPDVSGRNVVIGAAVLAAGVGLGAALFRHWQKTSAEGDNWGLEEDPGLRSTPGADFTVNSAISPVTAVGDEDRAPRAFRPDRDAKVPAGKRDAFAPATTPVPTRAMAGGSGDE